MKQKELIRSILVAESLMFIPLIAMQFTNEVDWDLRDFIVVSFLLAGIGTAFQMFVSGIKNNPRQAVMGVILAAAMLLIWAELAVGIFGSPFAGS